MIHLICGPAGSGKTTEARRIATKRNAELLQVDEFLKPLAFPPRFDAAFLNEVFKKYEQCALIIKEQSERFLSQRREVVLDVATFQREQREKARAWARGINTQLTLYYVCADAATRRARVLKRNMEKGETYSFDVPEWLFDLMERVFEPPTPEENPVCIVTAP